MAFATMAILRRNLVPLRVIEPWVARIAAAARRQVAASATRTWSGGNPEAFLRALYLQLASRRDHPTCAPTCCSVLVDA